MKAFRNSFAALFFFASIAGFAIADVLGPNGGVGSGSFEGSVSSITYEENAEGEVETTEIVVTNSNGESVTITNDENIVLGHYDDIDQFGDKLSLGNKVRLRIKDGNLTGVTVIVEVTVVTRTSPSPDTPKK